MEGNSVSFNIMDGHTAALGEVFARQKILGRLPREWDCYPVMVLLFLSMLPLHVDNPLRQKALLANAMRLYLEAKS
jgi:hypothetical protein